MRQSKSKEFPVATISREWLEDMGFESNLPDKKMLALAKLLGVMIGGFSEHLYDACAELDIPLKEDE